MDTRPLLLGHRGARAKFIAENTLASFDLALDSGCDGFEFDVRLDSVGNAVICHDPLPDGREIACFSGEELRLAGLREVLARYQHTAFLDIELKVAGLEAITVDLLRQFPPKRGFVVSSFLPGVLKNIQKIDPAVPLGLICETPSQLQRWQQLSVDYLILHRELFRDAKRDPELTRGAKLFVWTINTAAQIKEFANSGADGIISDHPAQLAQAFDVRAQK